VSGLWQNRDKKRNHKPTLTIGTNITSRIEGRREKRRQHCWVYWASLGYVFILTMYLLHCELADSISMLCERLTLTMHHGVWMHNQTSAFQPALDPRNKAIVHTNSPGFKLKKLLLFSEYVLCMCSIICLLFWTDIYWYWQLC